MKRIVSFSRALEILKDGNPIIVIDDENRENEGDLLMPMQTATVEWVNFFITHGRGLLCCPISSQIATQIGASLMPKSVSLPAHSCNFAISIDAAKGITTGISAYDRWYTMRQLLIPEITAHDFITPGHCFPLIAHSEGIQKRRGHTEASLELCKNLGFPEVAMICEILNIDGTMARLPDLEIFAEEKGLFILTIEEIDKYKTG